MAKAIVLFFPVNEEEEDDECGGEQAAEDRNYNAIFCSNAVKLYS